MSGSVASTRENPDPVGNRGLDDITASYVDVIDGLDSKPIVVGHSFGGLVAQKLLSGGHAAAAIAIDPGQIKGVRPVPVAQIRSGLPVLSKPGNRKRSVLPDRGPLLVTGGGMDHTVPEVVAPAAYKLYAGSAATTDYKAFPDRGHSLVFDHGWREIADYTLDWLKRQGL